MKITVRHVVAAAVILTAALVWFLTRGGSDPDPAEAVESSSTAPATINPTSTATPTSPNGTATATPTADPMESDDPDPVGDVPTWDEDSQAAAAAAAVAVVTAYGDSDLTQQSWWDQLSPLLTSNAQQTYSWVDPAVFYPFTVTTDPEVPGDVDSAYVVTVEVPTSIGTMSVLLIRADRTAPWLADQILFPEDGTNG